MTTHLGNLAAFAVVERDGEVLLVRRAYGAFDWALPGGALGSGESIAHGLAREIQEEVSLDVPVHRDGRIFAVSYARQEYSVAFLVDVPWAGRAEPATNPGEILDARFVPPAIAVTMMLP